MAAVAPPPLSGDELMKRSLQVAHPKAALDPFISPVFRVTRMSSPACMLTQSFMTHAPSVSRLGRGGDITCKRRLRRVYASGSCRRRPTIETDRPEHWQATGAARRRAPSSGIRLPGALTAALSMLLTDPAHCQRSLTATPVNQRLATSCSSAWPNVG